MSFWCQTAALKRCIVFVGMRIFNSIDFFSAISHLISDVDNIKWYPLLEARNEMIFSQIIALSTSGTPMGEYLETIYIYWYILKS